MRFSLLSATVVALAAESTVASSWFSKAAYNKWHETELERWLSDHNIPYPTPADRKDLTNLVNDNWENLIVQPYNSWDTKQLQEYLSSKGEKTKKGAEANKESLLKQVKASWFETEEQANDGYNDMKGWIFDTWTESQLKEFLDKNNIPSPQPRTRDSLLTTARSNYQSVATSAGEYAAYPGNWLWASWSDSDLKAWLDARGIPAPQGNERNQLIASVRRNSRLASQRVDAATASAKASAKANSDLAAKKAKDAREQLSDSIINGWSDTQLKAWADKNGINVPQGSKKNEIVALVRKYRAGLESDATAAQKSASSVLGEASGGLAQATNAVYSILDQAKQALFGASVTVTSEASKATQKAKDEL